MQILNFTLTKHAIERSMERSISPEQILQKVTMYLTEHGNTLYQNKGLAVVCDKQSIVTVMHRLPKLNKELWKLCLTALPLYVPPKPINPLFGACYREWEQAERALCPQDFRDTGKCTPGVELLLEGQCVPFSEALLEERAKGIVTAYRMKGV